LCYWFFEKSVYRGGSRRRKPTLFYDFQLNSYQCPYRRNCVGFCSFYYKWIWVRREWRHFSRFNFSNLLFWAFFIMFGEVCKSTHVGILVFVIYWKISYKIRKNWLWRQFERPRYIILTKINYSGPYIADSTQYCRFFLGKKLSTILDSLL
jgi:hypothetical protein